VTEPVCRQVRQQSGSGQGPGQDRVRSRCRGDLGDGGTGVGRPSCDLRRREAGCAAIRAGPQWPVDGLAHCRLRAQGKARLRPDLAKLVISVGRALARHAVIVALPEQIDVTNAAGVAEQLTSAVSRRPAVLADMTATRFCDCAGARAILRAYICATGSGAELRLVVTTEPVRRIFSLLGSTACLRFIPAWRQRAARCPAAGQAWARGKPRSRPSEQTGRDEV
jgi:anti-anti-sigma factor